MSYFLFSSAILRGYRADIALIAIRTASRRKFEPELHVSNALWMSALSALLFGTGPIASGRLTAILILRHLPAGT